MRFIISQIIIIITIIICIHFEMFGQPKILFIRFDKDDIEGFNDECKIVENIIIQTCDIEESKQIPYARWGRKKDEKKLKLLSKWAITHLIEGKVIPNVNDEVIEIRITIKDGSLGTLHKFEIKNILSDDKNFLEQSESLADNIHSFVNGGEIKEGISVEDFDAKEEQKFYKKGIKTQLEKILVFGGDSIINNKYTFNFVETAESGNIIRGKVWLSKDDSLINIRIETALEGNLKTDKWIKENIIKENYLDEIIKYAEELIMKLKQ